MKFWWRYASSFLYHSMEFCLVHLCIQNLVIILSATSLISFSFLLSAGKTWLCGRYEWQLRFSSYWGLVWKWEESRLVKILYMSNSIFIQNNFEYQKRSSGHYFIESGTALFWWHATILKQKNIRVFVVLCLVFQTSSILR